VKQHQGHLNQRSHNLGLNHQEKLDQMQNQQVPPNLEQQNLKQISQVKVLQDKSLLSQHQHQELQHQE
jgi:hypothetical protein